MIDLLKKRGTLITKNGLKKDIVQNEQAIKELIDENKTTLSTPIAAFVTFTNEEGHDRAIKYMNQRNKRSYAPLEILGKKINAREAPEPSDIIWENLHVNYSTQKRNEFIAAAVITFFLGFTLVVFTWLKAFAGENKFKFPPSKDCQQVDSIYGAFNTTTGKVTFNDE